MANTAMNLSSLSRGIGEVQRRGHEKIEVKLEKEDYHNWIDGSGQLWRLPPPKIAFQPAKIRFENHQNDSVGVSSDFTPSYPIDLPKTFTTRKGALLLFSEDIALTDRKRSRQRRRRHVGRKGTNSRLSHSADVGIHTVDDLTKSILSYGSSNLQSVDDNANSIYMKFIHSKAQRYYERRVKPGFSAKRYLGSWTQYWDQALLKRVAGKGFIKQVYFNPSRKGLYTNKIDTDLSGIPLPYRIMRQWLMAPGSIDGYTFYRAHTSDTDFGLEAIEEQSPQPPRPEVPNPDVSLRHAGGAKRRGTKRLASGSIKISSAQDGTSVDYSELDSSTKESVLAELLVKSAVTHAIQKQKEYLENAAKDPLLTGDQASELSAAYLIEFNMMEAIESVLEHGSVDQAPKQANIELDPSILPPLEKVPAGMAAGVDPDSDSLGGGGPMLGALPAARRGGFRGTKMPPKRKAPESMTSATSKTDLDNFQEDEKDWSLRESSQQPRHTLVHQPPQHYPQPKHSQETPQLTRAPPLRSTALHVSHQPKRAPPPAPLVDSSDDEGAAVWPGARIREGRSLMKGSGESLSLGFGLRPQPPLPPAPLAPGMALSMPHLPPIQTTGGQQAQGNPPLDSVLPPDTKDLVGSSLDAAEGTHEIKPYDENSNLSLDNLLRCDINMAASDYGEYGQSEGSVDDGFADDGDNACHTEYSGDGNNGNDNGDNTDRDEIRRRTKNDTDFKTPTGSSGSPTKSVKFAVDFPSDHRPSGTSSSVSSGEEVLTRQATYSSLPLSERLVKLDSDLEEAERNQFHWHKEEIINGELDGVAADAEGRRQNITATNDLTDKADEDPKSFFFTPSPLLHLVGTKVEIAAPGLKINGAQVSELVVKHTPCRTDTADTVQCPSTFSSETIVSIPSGQSYDPLPFPDGWPYSSRRRYSENVLTHPEVCERPHSSARHNSICSDQITDSPSGHGLRETSQSATSFHHLPLTNPPRLRINSARETSNDCSSDNLIRKRDVTELSIGRCSSASNSVIKAMLDCGDADTVEKLFLTNFRTVSHDIKEEPRKELWDSSEHSLLESKGARSGDSGLTVSGQSYTDGVSAVSGSGLPSFAEPPKPGGKFKAKRPPDAFKNLGRVPYAQRAIDYNKGDFNPLGGFTVHRIKAPTPPPQPISELLVRESLPFSGPLPTSVPSLSEAGKRSRQPKSELLNTLTRPLSPTESLSDIHLPGVAYEDSDQETIKDDSSARSKIESSQHEGESGDEDAKTKSSQHGDTSALQSSLSRDISIRGDSSREEASGAVEPAAQVMEVLADTAKKIAHAVLQNPNAGHDIVADIEKAAGLFSEEVPSIGPLRVQTADEETDGVYSRDPSKPASAASAAEYKEKIRSAIHSAISKSLGSDIEIPPDTDISEDLLEKLASGSVSVADLELVYDEERATSVFRSRVASSNKPVSAAMSHLTRTTPHTPTPTPRESPEPIVDQAALEAQMAAAEEAERVRKEEEEKVLAAQRQVQVEERLAKKKLEIEAKVAKEREEEAVRVEEEGDSPTYTPKKKAAVQKKIDEEVAEKTRLVEEEARKKKEEEEEKEASRIKEEEEVARVKAEEEAVKVKAAEEAAQEAARKKAEKSKENFVIRKTDSDKAPAGLGNAPLSPKSKAKGKPAEKKPPQKKESKAKKPSIKQGAKKKKLSAPKKESSPTPATAEPEVEPEPKEPTPPPQEEEDVPDERTPTPQEEEEEDMEFVIVRDEEEEEDKELPPEPLVKQFFSDSEESSDDETPVDSKIPPAQDDSVYSVSNKDAQAAKRAAAKEKRKRDMERRRKEREDRIKAEKEEAEREERVKQQMEDLRRQREDEARQKRLQAEEERDREEREENEKFQREQDRIAREKRKKEEHMRYLAKLRAKTEEEERRRKEEAERLALEEEERRIAEEAMLAEMEDAERAEYERRKKEEEERRRIEEEEQRAAAMILQERMRIKREAEAARAMEEARRLAEEMARAQEALRLRLLFQRGLLTESQGLSRTQDITRAFVFSYYELLRELGLALPDFETFQKELMRPR